MLKTTARRLTHATLLALAVLVATGCAANTAYRRGQSDELAGDWDDAVLKYMTAVAADPSDIKYQASLLRAKIKASQAHFSKGKDFEKAGAQERAMIEYQEATQLDPTNQYAAAQLEHMKRVIAARRENRSVETIDDMKRKTRYTRPQPPMLNPRSTQPISLEFPQAVSIIQIYRALAQAFGINVLFDPALKDQDIAIDLKDVTAQAALETLMHAAGHFYKVIDEHTILIAADNPQNRRTYEDLVIQTFFLSNAEVKDMTTILRNLIDAKKIATNEQLNAIILRDTADKVKVAEKIIESNDKSKAEVVVDVELLQIDTTKMSDLGITLSQYNVTQTLDTGTALAASATSTSGTAGTTGTTGTAAPTGGGLRVSQIPFLNQGNWILNVPNFVYNFVRQNGEARLLAKPQLRITEGGKANLVIGDKVPIPLTTFNTSNTVGTSIVPITSFQYQDVGIKIEMEPRVHHNQEVTLKLKIEVSQLGTPITTNGQTEPTIGTRQFDSTIRLQDGETSFLAGLIRDDDSRNDTGIPGLSDLPIIGRLFSDKSRTSQHTDVVLTLTPHIIRQAEITEEDLLPIWVGTDANISFRGQSTRTESDTEGPFENPEGSPQDVQDAIRRRIERLPPGLRAGGGNPSPGSEPQAPPADEPDAVAPAPPPQAPPPGVNLAPVAPPSNIFNPTVPATPTPPAQPAPAPTPPPGTRSSALRQPAAAATPAPPEMAAERAAWATPPAPEMGATRAVAARSAAPATPATRPATTVAPAALRQDDTAADDSAAVRLFLLPKQIAVAAGEEFQVAVQVSADRPISHLPFSLTFDPQTLAVAAVAAGDFLGPAGKAEVMSDYSHPGEVVVGASRLGAQPGVTGAGTLVTVTFRALAAGSALVGFTGTQALDPKLQRVLPIAVHPAHVVVGQGGGGGGKGPGGRQPQVAAPAPPLPPSNNGKVPPAAGVGPVDG